MNKYDRGWKKPKWKTLKWYNAKIQTQATIRRKQSKNVIKKWMNLLTYKVKKI
jgi:hypothetical protein